MLVTWLVELWLNQLGKLGDQMESDGFNHCKEEKEILEEEFRLFLGNKGIRVSEGIIGSVIIRESPKNSCGIP